MLELAALENVVLVYVVDFKHPRRLLRGGAPEQREDAGGKRLKVNAVDIAARAVLDEVRPKLLDVAEQYINQTGIKELAFDETPIKSVSILSAHQYKERR